MNVELRGTIRASLRTAAVEVEVPAGGVPLSELLEHVALAHPRARRYIDGGSGSGAVLRAVHNGAVVASSDDPLVLPEDSLLLMHAVAGGGR